MSSHERGQKEFVSHFYTQSRLHFIGTWKERYARLLETLPDSVHGEPAPGPGGRRYVLHVDMDAFFASVSLRDRPELMDKPVVISAASDTSNAEVSCPNYPARAFGVRAGMWMTKARELCPGLISINYEFEKYTEVAEIMYRALYETTPFVNGVSCDEAYLDITHLVGEIADEAEREAAIARLVQNLRTAIFERTSCHASVGVGASMLLARLATAKAKPNGWRIFQMDESGKATLASMPVRDLPQVGWKGARELVAKLGVETCGDLQRKSLEEIQRHFGPKRGKTMYNLCRGIDNRPWVPNGIKERQTIGTQISWGVRMETTKEVITFLEGLCEELVERISRSEKAGLGAKRISITLWKAKPDANPNHRKGSLGHGECNILQRTVALHHTATSAPEFLHHARKLLERLDCAPTDVRGLGVSASSFARPDRVLHDFFAPPSAPSKRIRSVNDDGKDEGLLKRSKVEKGVNEGARLQKEGDHDAEGNKEVVAEEERHGPNVDDVQASEASTRHRSLVEPEQTRDERAKISTQADEGLSSPTSKSSRGGDKPHERNDAVIALLNDSQDDDVMRDSIGDDAKVVEIEDDAFAKPRHERASVDEGSNIEVGKETNGEVISLDDDDDDDEYDNNGDDSDNPMAFARNGRSKDALALSHQE
ncbi:DNA repair protein REV1 [Hondaea fermentalgiana]|uniref:DNA repair protein REV1 n=1 Tax=Hondaea fermentalgiana TaxID=2315210 RepID=A0A2R5GEC3_9STRA|nr:DNA repair protein REV1 [Hondaea fermentalgiana]|eukprot:GBG28679.1 DNA repair protein REV1 [Hondaea fermentalgiana]